MNSFRKQPLRVRQAEMKARQRAKLPKRGRPPEVGPWGITVSQRMRKRIAALVLLQNGRSVETVASVLEVSPEAVRRWVERGMPIERDDVVRGLSLA